MAHTSQNAAIRDRRRSRPAGVFTHIHLFWVAGLLLAMIDLPDFGTPLRSIAGSVAAIAGVPANIDEETETSEPPQKAAPDTDAPDETEASSEISTGEDGVQGHA